MFIEEDIAIEVSKELSNCLFFFFVELISAAFSAISASSILRLLDLIRIFLAEDSISYMKSRSSIDASFGVWGSWRPDFLPGVAGILIYTYSIVYMVIWLLCGRFGYR